MLDQQELNIKIGERIAEELTAEIKVQVHLTNLNNKDKIANSFYCEVDPRSGDIDIKSTWPPAFFLDKGTKSYVRTDLLGKKVPVKIRGVTLIRTVSWKDIVTGHWRHPGIKGRGFLERAMLAIKPRLARIIREEITERNLDG